MCTLQKQGNLYILTLTGNNEHRLNPTLITSIQSTLSQIRSQVLKSKTPSALITTSQGKFFSNGYDLTFSNSSPSNAKLMVYQFQTLISEFLSLPMPTISAITGHASAAGFILAMAHDYVVMRRERGFLYMSELDVGLKLPRWFVAMVNCKIGQPLMRKRVVLRAEKVTGEMGKEMGLVDQVFDGEEGTIDGAIKLGENLVKRGWDGEIYGVTRKKMFKEVFDELGFDESVEENEDEKEDCGKKDKKREIRPRL